MTTQQEIVAELGTQPTIHPVTEINKRINFLKDMLRTSGMNGYVLGISGGQDSTLAGKLAQLAINEIRAEDPDSTVFFHAVRLPYGEQRDEADAQAALAFINPDVSTTFNIKPMVDAFATTFNGLPNENLTDFNKGNVKARARMIAQYALAGQHKLLVVGTDHSSENVTGFFTKGGDGLADLLPLDGLSKRQGRSLLWTLNAPDLLISKVPTADLLDNVVAQPDETELGLSYDEIDDFVEGREVSPEASEKIIARYVMTRHKRALPITPSDTWWKN